jgi:hypothetical protein
MTRKDIIHMALKAGLHPYYDAQSKAIERFAVLVAQECADWAAMCIVMDKAQMPQDPHSVGWNAGVAYASKEIKKHFEIRENKT